MNKSLFIGMIVSFCLMSWCGGDGADPGRGPDITVNENTARPWCYWYWLGCSVSEQDLRDNLTGLKEAGLGGVHLIPYYGVQGNEKSDLPWFGPEWMNLLKASIDQCKKLKLGFDMTPGTGWPFGGPDTTDKDASLCMKIVTVDPKTISFSVWQKSCQGQVAALVCRDASGKNIVTLDANQLARDFIFPESARSAVALIAQRTNQMVKRAAPGAEGRVIDYFNPDAVVRYTNFFDKSFQSAGINRNDVRAFYNDSFETYDANWTGDFLNAFRKQRGYDLLPYLPVLASSQKDDTYRRLLSDYCETLGDLQLDWVIAWTKRCHEMGLIVRNEAHGAPGNISDLYAAVDIPETEGFGVTEFTIPGLNYNKDYPGASGRPNPYIYKFASSAAHIKGTPLVSSETFTWLFEHFQETLSGMKPEVDQYFLGGINHVFFIGSSVSPKTANFPGWKHYFTCDFSRFSPVWSDLNLFSNYIKNCQTLFQNSISDNDILLYHPIHDFWYREAPNNHVYLFTVHAASHWLFGQPLGRTMKHLTEQGYSWDVISDRMIQEKLNVKEGELVAGSIETWQTILVPECQFMPLATMQSLLKLAKNGAKIIFEKALPQDVPGLTDLENRRHEFETVRKQMALLPNIMVTSDLDKTLKENAICCETMVTQGLSFLRSQKRGKPCYFVSNLGNRFKEGPVRLSKGTGPWVHYDPLTDTKHQIRLDDKGQLYLQLEPGQSCFLISNPTATNLPVIPKVIEESAIAIPLSGEWQLQALNGGPVLPPSATMKDQSLPSWTTLGGEWLRFGGTVRYSLDFSLTDEQLASGDLFRLILNDVRERARIKINGNDLGPLWCLPWKKDVPHKFLKSKNHLEIEITNTWYNRVIDLDQRKIPWKIMKDTNIVNVHYQSFDASKSTPLPSGLIGEISLVPCHQQ